MGSNALKCLYYVQCKEIVEMGEDFTSVCPMEIANQYWFWIGDKVVKNYYEACKHETEMAEAREQCTDVVRSNSSTH